MCHIAGAVNPLECSGVGGQVIMISCFHNFCLKVQSIMMFFRVPVSSV